MASREQIFKPERFRGSQEKQMNQLATVEMRQQTWEADTTQRNQLDNLKSNLQAQSMRLTEMCSKYTIDLHQTEIAHAQESKIVKRQLTDIRELEQKREQLSLQFAATMSNRHALQSKVEGTVQFAKALSEHRPRAQRSVEEVRMARDAEQAEMDALGAAVDALLAEFAALNEKYCNELAQLRTEVHSEREIRVLEITQHNRKIVELENHIKEKMFLSCKEQAINADHHTAIDTEQKQLLAVKNESEKMEMELKAQLTQVRANLDETQSRIPKHHVGIEKGNAMKSEYQKLVPLMKELELEQVKNKELLSATGTEKIKIVEKLEVVTNLKQIAEQEISKEIEELEKIVASEQATRDNRAKLIDKLALVENELTEQKVKKSDLEVYMQNLDETKTNIDIAKEELIIKFNNLQASIEKVDLDNAVHKEQLVEAERKIFDLEEEKKMIAEKIQQVETDNLTVDTEIEDIKIAITETRGQIELILAEKAQLIEQVVAIDSVLEKISLEKTDLKQRFEKTETELKSEIDENADLTEKIRAALSHAETLERSQLDETTNLESSESMINSKQEEIDCTTANIEKAMKVMETINDDYQGGTKLLESVQQAIELGTAENNALKKELDNANEMKASKDMEMKIIEEELGINEAIALSTENQEEALRLLNLEFAQEEEKAAKIPTEIKNALDEKSVANAESFKKLAALQQQKNADWKVIAAAETDLNVNAATELEIADKLKEAEALSAKAQMLHEKRLQAIAEAEQNAVEEQRSLEELEANLARATEEHFQQKGKVAAVDLKVKELENALALKSSYEEEDVEMVALNEKLKCEGNQLDSELKENSINKAQRRSHVRTVSTLWVTEMAALKEQLAKEHNKIKELKVQASSSLSNRKSPSSLMSTEKSLACAEKASPSGSLASLKKTKSPVTPLPKGKSPIASGFKPKSPILSVSPGKSPVLSGSHKISSISSHLKVRTVELWNVNASSTPISKENSNLQENLSPDEIQNSPIITDSSLRKKMKTKK